MAAPITRQDADLAAVDNAEFDAVIDVRSPARKRLRRMGLNPALPRRTGRRCHGLTPHGLPAVT